MKPFVKSAVVSLFVASPALASWDNPGLPGVLFIPPVSKVVLIPSKVKVQNKIPVLEVYSKNTSLEIDSECSDILEQLDFLLMMGSKTSESDYSHRYNMGVSEIQGDGKDGLATTDLVIGIDFFYPSDNQSQLMLEVRRISGSSLHFHSYYSKIEKALTQ